VRSSPTDPPARAQRLELALFLFGFLAYSATRFIRITEFPIYFFCDEALQANLAHDLVASGGRDQFGTLFPPYFLNDQRWDLSLSVYLHALPVSLLGKSISVTRGTEAAVNLLAPLALALALKQVFRARLWWSAPLVMAVIPTWFLHSRTAFQPAMTATFYACFLAAYLLYRLRSPRWIFAALLFGAATFYSYTAGQGLMLVTGLLLLICDWRYHFSHRKGGIAAALALALLLAVPYVRYRALHPNVVRDQLRVLQSYWVSPIPLGGKLGIFGKNYLRGFDPGYWFAPDRHDLVRHRMKGLEFLPVALLPFCLVGLAVCLRRWRSPAHRAVLIAPLGVPFSAAAASIGIMRVLSMVVPFTLFVCLGLEEVFARVRRRVPDAVFAGAAAAILGVWSLLLLRAALVEGPTWYRDYGLYGMQYGSPQVFSAIRDELARSPETQLLLSPTWSNNPNAFFHYFLTEPEKRRVSFGNLDPWMQSKQDIDPRLLFVLTAVEHDVAQSSGKFVIEPPARVIRYPDGTPGFYFVRLRYSDDIDDRIAADLEARRRLEEGSIELEGETVRVRHSRLDLGELEHGFDGARQTYFRGAEANPFVMEFEFRQARRLSGVVLDIGSMEFRLRIELTPAGGGKLAVFSGDFRGLPPDPHLDFAFPGAPRSVERVRLELTNIHTGEVANVHVREVAFR